MLLALTACGGGGGGGGGSSSPPSPRALASEFGSADHANNYGLSLIEADGEKAKDYDGTGSTLGIMDSIVYTNTPEMQGQKIRSLDGVRRSQSTTDFSHGTAVASVMIGRRDGRGIRGVAPSARLLTVALPIGTASGDYNPVIIDATTRTGSQDYATAYMQRLIKEGADAVNMSYGLEGLITSYKPEDVKRAYSRTIKIMAQAGSTKKNRVRDCRRQWSRQTL